MPDSASTRSSKLSTPRTPTRPALQIPSGRRSSISSITEWLSDIYTLFRNPSSGSDPSLGGSNGTDSSRLAPSPRRATTSRSVSSANSAMRSASPRNVARMTVYDKDAFPEHVMHLGTILVSRPQHQQSRDGSLRLNGISLREVSADEIQVPLCLCDKTRCVSYHFPLYPSNFQFHYQLTQDGSSVRLDPSTMTLIEVDNEGSEYTGADLKGRFVQPMQIFDWLEIPSPQDQWTSQCSQPRKEGSRLCETCESWHNTSMYGLQSPPSSRGVPAPEWLLKRERLIPENTILEEANQYSQIAPERPE